MKDQDNSQEAILYGAVALGGIAGLLAVGPITAILGFVMWNRTVLFKAMRKWKLFYLGISIAIISMITWYLWLDNFPIYFFEILNQEAFLHVKWVWIARLIDVGWFGGLGLLLLLAPILIQLKNLSPRVKSSDFIYHFKDIKKFMTIFEDKNKIPLGFDLKRGTVCYLTEEQCYSHVLILGATGSGKTTLIILMILHAVYHKRPCIVIDPKGSDSTLKFIRLIGKVLDPNFDKRFKAFRLSKPKDSCQYNPLKHGNASQIKDRILEALNWSEQHYHALAGEFLVTITACAEFLKMPLNFSEVIRLTTKEAQDGMLAILLEKANLGGVQGAEAKDLHDRLTALAGTLKDGDLSGLKAQLSILNSPAMTPVLSFTESQNEIDLYEVLKKDQIAYFQLSTLGNPDTARRLSRMITEDIKGLGSYVIDTVPEENLKYMPVFVDEFGSFASKEFIENIKQLREAHFGVHLSTQGLEDLDAVSPAFGRSSSANPLTKIAFRLDDSETVERVCSWAGTIEAEEQSYQVSGSFLPKKTGLGNMRKTRQMLVEHDVLKNLNIGQAVVIEKSPTRITALGVFNPKNLL